MINKHRRSQSWMHAENAYGLMVAGSCSPMTRLGYFLNSLMDGMLTLCVEFILFP